MTGMGEWLVWRFQTGCGDFKRDNIGGELDYTEEWRLSGGVWDLALSKYREGGTLEGRKDVRTE